MQDFLFAALPFFIIGISLALISANYKKKDREKEKNCLVEGMCVGMCLGVALSTALHGNIGLGISLGMLVGETIGIFIKKEKE